MTELAQVFSCCGESIVGILHQVDNGTTPQRGVLVLVGGPQYRVGSHRQFVILARYLAARGIPVLRFDYRGMGDSSGSERDFEAVEQDIRCAIDHFFYSLPNLKEVVIWGLCDAASAASFYAYKDNRVKGLVLLNPWVRTDEGIAKAYLKHYYLSRLMNPELWRKLVTGQFQFKASLVSLLGMVKSAIGFSVQPSVDQDTNNKINNSEQKTSIKSTSGQVSKTIPLPDRMLAGLTRYEGKLLFILSGDDLTADEFRDVVKASKKWQKCLKLADQYTLKEANHTFSQSRWREQVSKWTFDWVNSF